MIIPRLNIHFTLKEQLSFICRRNPYSPSKNEFLLNHSRSGIVMALQASCLPRDKKIGVMAYNCHTVMSAVRQAGYEIMFIDVTDKLFLDIDDLRRKRDSISALIVTHLFGLRNNVAAIRELFPDLLIIEDCAHLFNAEVYGDFATFSVGQGKFPSIGDGGILKVINPEYVSKVEKLYNEIPGYSCVEEIRLYIKLLFNSIAYFPAIYKVSFSLMRIRKPVKPSGDGYDIRKMSIGIRAMMPAALLRMEKEAETQILNVGKLSSILPETSSFYGDNAYMLVIRSDNPVDIQYKLICQGIYCATHFKNCLDWAKNFGYQDNSCPNTEYLVGKLTMVPTYKLIKK